MLYVAHPVTWVNTAANEHDYDRRKGVGNCAKCGTKIVIGPEETFLKDAGFGFNWIVSSTRSRLCKNCFTEMKLVSHKSTYTPRRVRRIGKTRVDHVDCEMVEDDPFCVPISS
jgi:hypothetical protein